MSQRLINLSPDLLRLRNVGYHVEVVGGYLVIRGVPYVNPKKEIKYGTLIAVLTLKGNMTTRPGDHTAMFAGESPCDAQGCPLSKIINGQGRTVLSGDLVRDYTFSSKPTCGFYVDYYEKMTTYELILSSPARAIDPAVTARTFPVIVTKEDESVFQYEDTASSRAEIGPVSKKLERGPMAIIGIGGTGSYILDSVAKTPVKEIHVFDGDKFSQHNAFRSPGAASIDELQAEPNKVAYHAAHYSKIHRHIIPHPYPIDESNVDELRGMEFVFLCMDSGKAKRLIIRKLEEFNVPFIDVGMGLQVVADSLVGQLRTTLSTPTQREHVHEKVAVTSDDEPNDYDRNIQVADLNALNAMLAVIRWKKWCGFYSDQDHEHSSIYMVDGNYLVNEDKHEA